VLNSFSLPVTGGITAAASGIWSDGSIVHFYAVGNQLYQVFIANYSSTNIWIYNLNDVITSIMVDSQNQYVFLTMNQSLIVYMFPFNNPYYPQVYLYNTLLYDFFLDAVLDVTNQNIYIAAYNEFVYLTNIYSNPIFSSSTPNNNYQVLSVTYDSSSNRVYYGGSNGVVWQVRATDVTKWTHKIIGVDSMQTALYDPMNNFVYFGSSIGLGEEVNNFAINRIFFDPNMNFIESALDSNHSTLFYTSSWGNGTSVLVRVDLTNFEVFSQLTFNDSMGPIIVDSTNLLLYWASTDQSVVYVISMTNCSLYGCGNCYQDMEYCGFCLSNRQCTTQANCPSNWQNNPANYTCPVIQSITPTSGNSLGGTTVQITGTFTLGSNVLTLSSVSCVFGNVATGAVAITATTVTCVTPAQTFPPSTTFLPVQVTVQYQGQLWSTNSLSFLYYDCAAFQPTCSQCLPQSECGVCLSSFQCSIENNCSSGWTQVCPSIVSLNPNSSSILGGTQVTGSVVPFFVQGQSYYCDFGIPQPPVSASISGNSFTCVTPYINSTTWNLIRNSQPDITTTFVLRQQSNAFVSFPNFLFYNCPDYSADCAGCMGAFTPQNQIVNCTFCFQTQQCHYNNVTCASSSAQCPIIQSALPPALYAYATNRTVVFNGLFDFYGNGTIAGGAYMCQWDSVAFSPATILNLTSLACSAPSLPPNVYPVAIYLNTSTSGPVPVTPPFNYEIYTCNSSSCLSCVGLRPQCVWCNSDLNCAQISSSACSNPTTLIQSNLSCPLLMNATPPADTFQGGDPIVLSGNLALNSVLSPNVSCSFSGTVVPAVQTSNNSVVCVAPPFSGSSLQGFVEILVNGTVYTNAIPFSWYECSKITGGCASCKNNTLCSWCGWYCADSCPSSSLSVSSCPVLTQVIPDFDYYTGGDPIMITGGPFVGVGRPDYNYVVSFNGVDDVPAQITTATINGNPVQVLSALTPSGYGIEVITVQLNGAPYAPGYGLNFTFFECSNPPTTACSPLCTQQPYCGWCLEQQICTGAVKCNSSIFLTDCFNVTVYPQVMPVQGKKPLYLIFNPPLPDVIVNAFFPNGTFGNNTIITPNGIVLARKRFAEEESDILSEYQQNVNGSLTCAIGSVTIPAQLLNNRTVLCSLGGPFVAGSTPVQVLWNNLPLNLPVDITFIDCSSLQPCQQCSSSAPFCGWCLEENQCSTQVDCPSTWVSGDCPTLTSLNPSVGFNTGGQQVTLTGKYFINNSAIHIKFGNSFTNATFVNNDTLLTVSAPGTTGLSVAVAVYYGNVPYTNSLQFSYIENVPVGLIVGMVILGVALVAGAILLFFFLRYRKRKKGLLVSYSEPDYIQVAFQNELQPHYKITAKDDYAFLEDCLLSRDRTFVRALVLVTAPTEYDLVSRSLVYLNHRVHAATELIQYFASEEVRVAPSENTLFRLNSVASKMFKFFSQLVGTKYLFHTLARVVNELNAVAEQAIKEREKQAKLQGEEVDRETTASLLTIEMEVDPSRIKDANVDTDTNIYQLSLACQKIFAAIYTSHEKVPPEFRFIFLRIKSAIEQQFGPESPGIYKALSGFLFLRFICPAITAPHYFGLMKQPPNQVAQRQLVLIAKVLQSLANMATSKKEQFMENMADFMERNIPKMKQFYDSLLDPVVKTNPKVQMHLSVPNVVRQNALAVMHTHIYRNEGKLRKIFKEIPDMDKSTQMVAMLDLILTKYGEPPKKSGGSKTKGKKQGTKESTAGAEPKSPPKAEAKVSSVEENVTTGAANPLNDLFNPRGDVQQPTTSSDNKLIEVGDVVSSNIPSTGTEQTQADVTAGNANVPEKERLIERIDGTDQTDTKMEPSNTAVDAPPEI